MDERLCYPIVIRLDAIDRVILCSPLLNVWNLITDLPGHATLFDRADARATAIYDKLFWGCNLPAITPAGEHSASPSCARAYAERLLYRS